MYGIKNEKRTSDPDSHDKKNTDDNGTKEVKNYFHEANSAVLF